MKKLLILPGDGIGPEVTKQCIKIIDFFKDQLDSDIEYEENLFGGASIDDNGKPLNDIVLKKALDADAVLLGAVGGPKWENLDHELKPESGLLKLRKELQTYANLRPGKVFKSLSDASSLKPDVLKDTDIFVVRELTGGIYFGEPRFFKKVDGKRVASNPLVYNEDEIIRVAKVAFDIARKRKNKVTSLDKANVLEVMQLWRDVVTEVHNKEYQDVELEHLYIDNAAMQVIKRPSSFDVILASNLFGDIISDEVAELTGSLGMLPSASVGANKAIYEPVHGSAPDIAGKNIANPIAAILSLSMMFKYSFNEVKAAQIIASSINSVIESGFCTKDIPIKDGKVIGTSELTKKIIGKLQDLYDE